MSTTTNLTRRRLRHCSNCVIILILLGICLFGVEASDRTSSFQIREATHNETESMQIPDYFPLIKMFGHALNRTKRSTSSSEFTEEEKKSILDYHNDMRRKIDATNMVTMKWNTDLEAEATRWASLCDFSHPKDIRVVGSFVGLGQNLFLSLGALKTIVVPVRVWYDETKYYSHDTYKCDSGRTCAHYTQIIWATTRHVGCAMKYCDPMTSAGWLEKGYYYVCEYAPLGNIYGMKPYKSGTKCSDCPKDMPHCVDELCCELDDASEEPPKKDRDNLAQPCHGSTNTTLFVTSVLFLYSLCGNVLSF